MRTVGRRRAFPVSLIGRYLRFNLAAAIEYRTAFLVQVFGMALNNSAFIFFWLILFERIGSDIRGYEFSDVMFVWAIVASGYGLAVVVMGNASQISRIVYTGELDVYLLQPKTVLPNVLFSRMVVSGIGDLLYGIVLFVATHPVTARNVALFVVFVALVATLMTAMRVLYHSFTFFFGNAEAFALTASDLAVSFVLYPGSIFRGPAVWLLHSLVPAALMGYIPVALFREFDPVRFGLLILADGAIVVIAIAAFHLGLRRYESGNRIGTRT